MAKLPVTYQTTISGNVVLLCRFLRKRGFLLGASEEAKALEALSWLPLTNEARFIYGLKTMLAKNRHQFKKFDEFYREFLEERSKAANSKQKEDTRESGGREMEALNRQDQFERLKNWLKLHPSGDAETIPSYSGQEVLAKKRFSELDPDEMKLMMRLLSQLAHQITHRKSRLRKTSINSRKLDLRRTMGRNLRKGTRIREFVFSEPKEKKLKIVLLADVSRSMELYSRFFIYLVYAFQNSHDRIETFVFSTALHQVSDILDNHDFDQAFRIIADKVPQWSGGTKIGSCFGEFIREFAYGLLDKKTIVFILSDGWDTGDPSAISGAMKSIHRQSRRVIWLNPLAGSPGFSPEAIGLKAALPYVDILAPAHNLESLKEAMLLMRSGRKSRFFGAGE
jgi:hypothetical protein